MIVALYHINSRKLTAILPPIPVMHECDDANIRYPLLK